jgi:hypothetical protein
MAAQQQFPFNPANPKNSAVTSTSVPAADITNARIIEMAKMGLDDEIVIAKK